MCAVVARKHDRPTGSSRSARRTLAFLPLIVGNLGVKGAAGSRALKLISLRWRSSPQQPQVQQPASAQPAPC